MWQAPHLHVPSTMSYIVDPIFIGFMMLKTAWRARPPLSAIGGGPLTPSPMRNCKGSRGVNWGQRASALMPVIYYQIVLPRANGFFFSVLMHIWLCCVLTKCYCITCDTNKDFITSQEFLALFTQHNASFRQLPRQLWILLNRTHYVSPINADPVLPVNHISCLWR